MKAAFRCDATPGLGGGHAMRCLTLANELRRRGDEVVFVCAPETLTTVPALAEAALDCLPAGPKAAESVAAIRAHWRDAADWLVIDSYAIDREEEIILSGAARRLMAIDDLADRPHDCDLLVDQTYGRKASDYAGLAPARATLLLGGEYALLRPEFAAGRARAISRRAVRGAARRALVSLGLTDLDGITARVVRELLALELDVSLDVVIGANAASLPELQLLALARPTLRLHVESRDVATLMIDADIAIGAGGVSSWERCCLGLPTVVIVLAGNQETVAAVLEAQGAVISAGGGVDAPARAARTLARLAADPRAMRDMSQAAFRVTDGNGARLVADAMTRLLATQT